MHFKNKGREREREAGGETSMHFSWAKMPDSFVRLPFAPAGVCIWFSFWEFSHLPAKNAAVTLTRISPQGETERESAGRERRGSCKLQARMRNRRTRIDPTRPSTDHSTLPFVLFYLCLHINKGVIFVCLLCLIGAIGSSQDAFFWPQGRGFYSLSSAGHRRRLLVSSVTPRSAVVN